MTTATSAALDTARELSAWFERVSDLAGQAFGWRSDRHGEASALHVLRRQAARVRSSRLATDGSSYTTLCLFLAAACRVLGLELAPRHWRAALRNVGQQRDLRADESLGVALGTPAERFKLLLDDAIDAAGLGSQVSILDEKKGRLALGLAVNWGVRTLLAYATEAKFRPSSSERGRQDLAWLRARVRNMHAES